MGEGTSGQTRGSGVGDLGLFDDASSRLYYAAFHLVSAALLTHGVQAQSHVGLATLLGQHLVRPGLLPAQVARELAALMGLRGQADYNRHFVMDAEGFTAVTKNADGLFAPLEAYLVGRGVKIA